MIGLVPLPPQPIVDALAKAPVRAVVVLSYVQSYFGVGPGADDVAATRRTAAEAWPDVAPTSSGAAVDTTKATIANLRTPPTL